MKRSDGKRTPAGRRSVSKANGRALSKGEGPKIAAEDVRCPHGILLASDEDCFGCNVALALTTESGQRFYEAVRNLPRKILAEKALVTLYDSSLVDMHRAVDQVADCLVFAGELRQLHDDHMGGDVRESVLRLGSESPAVSEKKLRHGTSIARLAAMADSRLEEATETCVKVIAKGQGITGAEPIEALLDAHDDVKRHLRAWANRSIVRQSVEIVDAVSELDSAMLDASRNGAGAVALKTVLNRLYGKFGSDSDGGPS
jgi:hypothetical protein